MRKILFASAVALGLAGCANGVPPLVTNGCADVSALQPLMPILVGLVGPAAPIVQAVYTAVEGACLTAPQVAQWIEAVSAAIHAALHGQPQPPVPAALMATVPHR